MKTFTVLLLLVSNIIYGQIADKHVKDNGIYITAKDYLDGVLTHGFDKRKDAKFLENKKSLIIIKHADSTCLFYYDQIWGFRKDGVDWRVFNESEYQVESIGKICIYNLPVCVVCQTIPPSYFSVDLTSPLHPLTRNYLINAFHDDTGFVNKIKQLPWSTSIMKRDKKTHRYRFVDWL